MSKHVLCPECNSENTAGSKFCNHCGARLPKSTSVLCPRCQTPNPNNNFYCDNCGSRLRAEPSNISAEEESKPEASDLPTSAKMFSLPARKPGDTGDLDPDKLPEWLKNQSEESEKEKKEGTGKLPRLSDLTPEERGTTADFPGWLISTDSEELLIDSPEDITTEHFLHLIQDINEEEREKLTGLLSDPTIVNDANLPDWLREVAQSTPKEESTPPPPEEPADDPDAVPDWLGELGPPRTAMLGKSDEVELSPAEPEFEPEGEELPDWLTEGAEPTEPTIESQTTEDIFSGAGLNDDDIPDWLVGDQQIEESQPDDISAGEEELDDLTLDATAATSLTGWLAEFETDDATEETAVSESPEQAVTPEEQPAEDIEAQRSLTSWLTAFDEEDLIPDDDTAEVEELGEPLPDWLTSDDEPETEAVADESAAKDDSFDWMTDISDLQEDAPATEPTAEAPITEDDSFDWLADFDETPGDKPVAAESATEAIDDSLDWLSTELTDEKQTIEPADEPADLLGVDISSDVSLSTGDTGPLPDWLDDLSPTGETSSEVDASELGSSLEDLFGETPKDATSTLEWLTEESEEEIEAEPDSVDSSLAPLVGAVGAAAILDASSQDDDDALLDEDPDWLSALADFDPNDIVEGEPVETAVSEPEPELPIEEDEFDVEAALEATEAADLDDFAMDDSLPGIDEQEAGDWIDINGILTGNAEDEALPDWLEQLDEVTASEIAALENGGEPPEEIPEWIANMRPGDTGQLSSVLPSALLTDSDTSELLKDTGDLDDADLPDWLDETIDQRVSTAEKESSGWFDGEDTSEAPAELEALLADLPPALAPEDMLQKAEIPEWLEELKPRELTGEAAPVVESRLESTGPLAGMPNTIAIEPIIAMPRAASRPSSYSISPEQAQQTILLRQLVQETPQPPQAGTTLIGTHGIAGLRIIVAILLLAAVILGLYGPEFLKSKALNDVPVPATTMNTAVSNAAGKTVLVAFEYTPALAGELNYEAETLLTQLNAIGSPILATSQYIAGTAVAESLTAPYNTTTLGLIPGEAMGLRQLGNCLGETTLTSSCTTLNNRVLSNEVTNAMADVGLIVVLTGERSSLVNWVEQVGANTDIPIVIGATQSLEPLVVPYFASAQVHGYLNGLPATVAYQQAYIQIPDSPATAQYGAQSLVLLVTAVILLIGGLAFGLGKKIS